MTFAPTTAKSCPTDFPSTYEVESFPYFYMKQGSYYYETLHKSLGSYSTWAVLREISSPTISQHATKVHYCLKNVLFTLAGTRYEYKIFANVRQHGGNSGAWSSSWRTLKVHGSQTHIPEWRTEDSAWSSTDDKYVWYITPSEFKVVKEDLTIIEFTQRVKK